MKIDIISFIYKFIVILLMLWGFIFSAQSCVYAMSTAINNDHVEMDRSGNEMSAKTTIDCTMGNGLQKKEQRDLPVFDKINVTGVFDINIGLQKKQSVEIFCDDNILSKISTRVSNGDLFINTTESICLKSKLTINIFLPNLDVLNCQGANSIIVEAMDNDRFGLKLDGANDVHISGKTVQLNIDLSGTGDLHAAHLQTEDVTITSQGTSDAHIHASKSLKVTLMGAGDIYYYGEPQVVSRIEGVGDLVKGN